MDEKIDKLDVYLLFFNEVSQWSTSIDFAK